MFNPSRGQVRDLFFETWRKSRACEPVAGVERIALEVVLMHPEYHAVLGEPERYRALEYFPELGETNPFLHMSMHVAIEEQLSIDQPRGVAQGFAAIAALHGDRHAALHDAMECLAEMVWRAQRDHAAPDGEAYLECLAQRARS